MKISATSVGMLHCRDYCRQEIKEAMDRICLTQPFHVRSGDKVLLKPNLVSGQRRDGLACTHPEFVAAAAEYFLDHGAMVLIGDSPAFGTARSVMKSCRITDALQGLPVRQVGFGRTRPVRLAGSVSAGIAAAALECDVLVNLPKIKTHGQLLLSLAIKNYFGTVAGMTKPWWHLRYGAHEKRFAALLVDLLAILPNGVTLADGVAAMHVDGPMNGRYFPLGLVAGSINPVALDTALLTTLGVECGRSLLWRECFERRLAGVQADSLVYPLLSPPEIGVRGFMAPKHLRPVSFNPFRMLISGVKRLVAGCK